MRAKKSLGQHFLKSERALVNIVGAGDISKKDTVLEIGPGTGALTEMLLATSCQLVAIEKDDDLYELLQEQFQKEILAGQLTLIHGDIMNFEIGSPDTSVGTPTLRRGYKLVANIPYNITGAILKKFLESDYQPEKMVLLVQKEVAKRIMGVRKHGVSTLGKESILSISVKAYGTPRYIETVKAGSFAPMPKVDSAIIAIDNISKTFFSEISDAINPVNTECLQEVEERFFEIVRAGFKSKRKKLSSNLAAIFPKEKVRETFQELYLDNNVRAEDVDIETWKKLVSSLVS